MRINALGDVMSDSSTDADPNSPQSVHVRLQVRPRRPDVEWADPPISLKRADGSYEVMGQSADLHGLARWVLSYGPRAEVLAPEALRRRVVEEARRVIERYGDGTPLTT